MADAVVSSEAPAPTSQGTSRRPPNPGMKLPIPSNVDSLRPGVQNLTVFSPVNQNGSFEFDRVLKTGAVQKRTKRTKNWKTIQLVLRPNVLSLYKDTEATKLRHQINLSDLTAVARQKDPKGKTQHIFGLFSPSRNFHLAAESEKEAQAWVDLIRSEARIDEDEEGMTLMSPVTTREEQYQSLRPSRREIVSSSDASENDPPNRPPKSVSRQANPGKRQTSFTANYSGNEGGSFSDFSDTAGPSGAIESNLSLTGPAPTTEAQAVYGLARKTTNQRNASQQSVPKADSERVVRHGWLYVLKSKRGVRQWKKLWVVLRPKALAFYKDEDEYSANLIIPFPNISDAVEIDPVSKTKKFCMQIITEERNYRFCAPDEDALARWLGAFKSLLVKRKEGQRARSASTSNNNGSSVPIAA